MKKNTESSASENDLQIVMLLVAKHLREEYGIDQAPLLTNFTITPTNRSFGPTAKLHVNLDIGRGVSVTVEFWWHEGERQIETLISSAEDISAKVANVRDQAPEIRSMLTEVKAATKRELAKAKRRGFPSEMTSAAFTPVEQTGYDDWVIRVEHQALGQSLRLEPFVFEAISLTDVGEVFADFCDNQSRRAARRAALDEIGATGTIDAVVVAAIADAGLNVAEVLTSLRDSDNQTVDVASDSDQCFALHWDEGAVFARVNLGDGVTWHENRLEFQKKAAKTLGQVDEGSPLSSFFDHPFLDERLVVQSFYGTKGERRTVYCNRALLAFDADTGRTWPT